MGVEIHSQYPAQFDIRAIVTALGGPTATYRLLEEYGCTVGKRAVDKWMERNIASADAVATMLAILEVFHGTTMEKFILDKKGNEDDEKCNDQSG